MRKALAFLTPFGGATTPAPGALTWFPVVGAAIGLAVGGVWWLAARAWPRPAADAVVIVADVAFTGYLHLDGLADSADGLLPPLPRQRRLDVMADPALGAFGVASLVVVLVLRFGSLASAAPAVLGVGALWTGSRTFMAVAARTFKYARPGGLATAFLEQPAASPRVAGGAGGDADRVAPRPRGDSSPELARPPAVRPVWVTAAIPAGVGVALEVVLAVVGSGAHGLVALAAELVGFAAVIGLALRRIGGYTGDVLGAAGVVGETLGLLTLVAKW